MYSSAERYSTYCSRYDSLTWMLKRRANRWRQEETRNDWSRTDHFGGTLGLTRRFAYTKRHLTRNSAGWRLASTVSQSLRSPRWGIKLWNERRTKAVIKCLMNGSMPVERLQSQFKKKVRPLKSVVSMHICLVSLIWRAIKSELVGVESTAASTPNAQYERIFQGVHSSQQCIQYNERSS